jgi:hypothetical protein
MRTEFALAPGSVQSGVLRLVNESQPTRVRGELLDFHLDREMTPQFNSSFPQEAAYSCRNWLQVNPMESELHATGELPIRYTIRVPADATPRTYYCAVGYTSLPTAERVKGIGMRSAVRIVSAFYIKVGNLPVQGQLKNIALERSPGGKALRAVVLVENQGKSYFRPTGTVEILDLSGQLIETFPIQPVPILPEREQRLLFPLAKLAEGQACKIHVKVEIGGEIQEGTAEVQAQALIR